MALDFGSQQIILYDKRPERGCLRLTQMLCVRIVKYVVLFDVIF